MILLRSSSTPAPVIETLIFLSCSDSPNRDLDVIHSNTNNNKNKPIKNANFLTFVHGAHHHNLKSFSCNSSPNHHSSSGFGASNREPNVSGQNSVRRARSEGNLERLLSSHELIDPNELRSPERETKFGFRHYWSMLRTEPSFAIFNDEFQDSEEAGPVAEALQRTVTIGETIEDANGGDFCFGKSKMGLIKEEEEPEVLGEEEATEQVNTRPLCIASGLGINGEGLGLSMMDFDETSDTEEYYKRMVEQCPFHPLFLRNYAQFLQSKGDLYGAEEYYSRASVADPEDGDIWMQYAKLVWDLYHDQERASSYFKLATKAAPQDSNVLAAYASFLWDIEDSGEEDDGAFDNQLQKEDSTPCLNTAGGTRIDGPDSTAVDPCHSGNPDVYYRKMIEENPNNALFLRNYATFLYECKGDLQGAEEYYSRTILADPSDGEIMAQYARLVWELHHDGQKTLSFFERAVQACPHNSSVLAAYASFLWENEDDEEEQQQQQVSVPGFHEMAMTVASV
ncbi:uncharacterized protein LOC133819674 isoform X2 [Humulus lupulus]|uniref:uncharacterized protein LOC133819674 isoform X2 n=1 Tax=Humulus lupulus TaxID=3486 RepID=UPI002B413B59|nr:uncharacterized protein LOC133819674 isoform X2 [Humulus lupulus]